MQAPMDGEARARLAGRRAAHGVILVVAFLFIGVSAGQIIPAVFGARVHPLASAAPGSPERSCAEGIRVLSVARSEDTAIVAQACARAEHGSEAWASLLRLRRAEEQLGGSRAEELEPLRKDVIAHLPAEFR